MGHDIYTAAALIGTPRGYIGSGEPGRLVTDLWAHPNAVLLTDGADAGHARPAPETLTTRE
jgi:ATP-dependent Clp protease ATP-binding subunit ClpA